MELIAQQGQEAARGVAFPLLVAAGCSEIKAPPKRQLELIPADGVANSLDEAAVPREYCVGRTAWLFGNKEFAQTSLTAARSIFERTTREQPDYPQAWSYLGLTDAMLGRRKDAIREGKRACEVLPYTEGFLGRTDIHDLPGRDLRDVRRKRGGAATTQNLSRTSGRA